jgi:hypothetical protein
VASVACSATRHQNDRIALRPLRELAALAKYRHEARGVTIYAVTRPRLLKQFRDTVLWVVIDDEVVTIW